MRGLIALASGLLFGFGLLISGMANPAKVLGFLDLAGAWDPSLALVMAGAVAVAFVPMQWIQRRGITLRGEQAQLPTSRIIDRRLVLGSLLFGAGWGVAGFCPGPALVAASALMPQALLLVAAMLLGVNLKHVISDVKLPEFSLGIIPLNDMSMSTLAMSTLLAVMAAGVATSLWFSEDM